MTARSTVSSAKSVTVTLSTPAGGRGQPKLGRRPSPPCFPPARGLARWPPGTAGPSYRAADDQLPAFAAS
jgi:hypothetical protein